MSISVKKIGIIIAVVLIVFNALLTQIVLKTRPWTISILVGCFLLLMIVLIVFSESKSLSFKFNKPLIILQEIVALGFIFNGLLFHVFGYIAIGLIYSVILPVTYAVFNNDNLNITSLFSKGVIVSFIIFAVISVLIGPPLMMHQYTAILRNPNAVGFFSVVVVAVCIYLIITEQTTLGYKIVLGFALAFVYFTNSRTAVIAIIMQILIVSAILIISSFRKKGKQSVKTIIKIAIGYIILFVICSLMTFGLLTTCKLSIQKALPDIQMSYKHETILDLSMIIKLPGSKFSKGLGEFNEEDEFTSGRIEIWKQFGQNVGLIGHETESREIVEENRYYQMTNAHNVYLQIAYSAGLISGISMLLYIIVLCVIIIRTIIRIIIARENIEPDLIYAGCLAVAFLMVSLTSAGYMIFTYPVATFFWLNNYHEIKGYNN